MPSDKEVMKGGPDDPIETNDDPQNPPDGGEGGDDKKPLYVTQEQLAEFQSRQDRIFNMLEGLTKKPAAEPEPNPTKKSGQIAGMSQEEFEQLFWDNPAAALDKYKATILTEVRAETGKTQTAQAFWTDFYSDNEDLKKDSDLVQLVLNQNMASLADLPVAEAKVKLADLTRKRILRYSGESNGGGERKKVIVEGSQHRIPSQERKEPEAPKTLGELIRARKAARRNNGKAVAT